MPELKADVRQPTRAVLDESAALDAWNHGSVLELSHYMWNVLPRQTDNGSIVHMEAIFEWQRCLGASMDPLCGATIVRKPPVRK
jgi:hypothetical protein